MNRRDFVRNSALLCGASLLAPIANTLAQNSFPTRPVTLIYPWPPGGPGDVLSRFYSQKMGERLHQSIIVEGRPGATGAIGLSSAKRATPDGYTWALASIDTHALNPNFNKNLTYDPLADFAAIGGMGRVPMAICVAEPSKYPDLAAFLQAAKSAKQALTYSTWGAGSLAHVTMAYLASQAKVDMIHVPYQGASAALQDLIGGQVDATVLPLNMAVASAKGNRIKILATTTEDRAMPELPTVREAGIPLEVHNWFGLITQAKAPSDVVEMMSGETLKLVNEPLWAELLHPQSLEPFAASAADFKTFIAAEHQRWGNVMRDLGIELA